MRKAIRLSLFLSAFWSMVSIAMDLPADQAEIQDEELIEELPDNFSARPQAVLPRTQSEPRPVGDPIKIPRKLSEPMPRRAPAYLPIKQSPEVMQVLKDAQAAIAQATTGHQLKFKNYRKIVLLDSITYIFMAYEGMFLHLITVIKTINSDGSISYEASTKRNS